MRGLRKLIATECTLVRRDLAAVLLPFLLPVGLMVGFGSAPTLREAAPEFGGMSAFEVHIVPIALVLVLPLLGLMVLPVTLATYRERGVLRRLATTPLHPASVLLAQLAVHLGLLTASLGVTATVARLAFDVAAPRRPLVSLGLLALGTVAIYTLGLAVAALAPRAGTATAVSMGLFFPQLLVGGLMVPADQLPDLLARIGELTPVGATMRGIQDAWTGTAPPAMALLVLLAWTAAAMTVAVRRFRWD